MIRLEYDICELLLDPERMKAFDGSKGLVWWPEVGVGYYPVEAGTAPYDSDYFEKYTAMAKTDMGRAIARARIAFVHSNWAGRLVDIGIGCGAFIMARNDSALQLPPTYGYDVNPAGVEWLKSRGAYIDIYDSRFEVDAVTLWDVFEHIRDLRSLVDRVGQFVFMSLPIFVNMNHVRVSKHFRRDEHCWYFTPHGLCAVMNHLGFELIDSSRAETDLGREDIGTFAFRRRVAHAR